MIYHLLPEAEPFSAKTGGALSRIVANIMRRDESHHVVCPSADDTWQIGNDRITTVSQLASFSRIRGNRFIPLPIVKRYLSHVFGPGKLDLKEGDLVWCHNRPMFAIALQQRARSSGAKIVYHFHDAHRRNETVWSFSQFQPDATVFISEYLRDEWLKAIPRLSSYRVVHNGADEKSFFPDRHSRSEDKRSPIVLFVGRLHPEKGAHVLVEAIRRLNDRGIKMECRIVGSAFASGTVDSQYIKRLKADAPDNIKFIGHCPADQIANEYRGADILCCPSQWAEPFGMVNIEAMACGTPVIASNVGAIPEIARTGGVLLFDHGSVESLVNALERMLIDTRFRNAMGVEALNAFKSHFQFDSIMKQYRIIVEELQSLP